jgi:hypothetical protein
MDGLSEAQPALPPGLSGSKPISPMFRIYLVHLADSKSANDRLCAGTARVAPACGLPKPPRTHQLSSHTCVAPSYTCLRSSSTQAHNGVAAPCTCPIPVPAKSRCLQARSTSPEKQLLRRPWLKALLVAGICLTVFLLLFLRRPSGTSSTRHSRHVAVIDSGSSGTRMCALIPCRSSASGNPLRTLLHCSGSTTPTPCTAVHQGHPHPATVERAGTGLDCVLPFRTSRNASSLTMPSSHSAVILPAPETHATALPASSAARGCASCTCPIPPLRRLHLTTVLCCTART